jgi:predicted dehydrogenase
MSHDHEISRRDFLKKGAQSGAGLAALSGITFITRPERVFGANDRVRVAVTGLHGRGWDHVKELSALQDVEIAAFCDVDENVTRDRLAEAEKMNLPKPVAFVDFRKLLDEKSIDAVTLATPNHWHSLQAIWACQAGKDVYVEKPCSHNLWEGRQLVRAAEKYNRIVQHGTQSRSHQGIVEGVQKIRDGLIGDLYLARGLCFKWRDTIGHTPHTPVPPGVHYDLWTGPAPLKPFTKNRFHYNWHWIWDTGNGDIGNQGVHEMDIARWGLGLKWPKKISAIGGHFMFDDDQQTPNTLNAAYQYDLPNGKRCMLEFEVRHWITNHEARIGTEAFGESNIPAATGNPQLSGQHGKGPQNTIGNIFYGSKGYMSMDGYEGYMTWLNEEQDPGPSGKGGGDHFRNFIDCVRSRKKEDLHAPIEEGYISAGLVHLANASYRLGRTLYFDPEKQEVVGDVEANRLLRDGDRGYRKPYVVPEQV